MFRCSVLSIFIYLLSNRSYLGLGPAGAHRARASCTSRQGCSPVNPRIPTGAIQKRTPNVSPKMTDMRPSWHNLVEAGTVEFCCTPMMSRRSLEPGRDPLSMSCMTRTQQKQSEVRRAHNSEKGSRVATCLVTPGYCPFHAPCTFPDCSAAWGMLAGLFRREFDWR